MPGRKEELRDTVWRSDPHTLVKHLVYRHYLECWMPKILQGFPRATIVDAFAGPGTYADGLDGSPILVAKTFLTHSAHARFVGRLDLICLEQREDRVDRLRHEVAALGPTPKLTVTVVEPGEFVAEQPRLAERAHGGEAARPVLWLLDPFKITSLPFETVIACLAGRRDEAVVTFFVDEMHRFCTRDGFDKALNRHFGSGRWTTARDVAGEGPRKEALVTAYREGLDAEGLLTGHFGVRVRNDTARYHLVFATHSEYGLKCWNPVKWKLDSFAGTGASAATAEQPDLFGVSYIGELRTALRAYSGTEQSWRALLAQTIQRGFMERHLRAALDALAAEGLAFRVDPTEAWSAWPEGCVVRFYEPEDADVEVVEPLDSQTAAREGDGISS